MKPPRLLLFLALATSAALPVCPAATVLFPVVVNDRWGFVDNSGNIVINPQFDRADVFESGLAAVRLGRWGYVGTAGKLVVNPQFDRADSFSEPSNSAITSASLIWKANMSSTRSSTTPGRSPKIAPP